MTRFGHLATRLFNVPLMIHPHKAEIVLGALAERLGIAHVMRADGSELVPMAMEDQEMEPMARAQSNPRAGYDNLGGVAVIEVSGTLVNKLGSLKPYSGMTGYDGIRQNFMMAMTDPSVRAVCLDIDSPGGEVAGCFDLVDAVYEARGDKPIWSILSENALSAGYAIASSGDKIIVPRTGNVGSVGVICMHVDWSESMKQAGIKVTFLQYGERKADGSPEQPLSDAARKRFQADIDAMGELFVATVARNRGMDADKIRGTQAATYLGAEGVALGLADAVMAPDEAFRALIQELS